MAAGGQQRRRLEDFCVKSGKVHAELRARYRLDHIEWADAEIRGAYKRGLHAEVSAQVLRFLEEKFQSQAEMADFLGVERSAISKMKSSSSVRAPYLELAIAIGFALDRENANRNGLIEAAHCVREEIIKEEGGNQRMTETDYAELLLGERNGWYDAFVLALMEVEHWIGE